MDHRLRELERRARLDPSLRTALQRARRRASLPPLDLPGIQAEAQRLEAELRAARDACALAHARLLEPLLRALFDEQPALDVLVASWSGSGQGGVFVHVALDGPEVLAAAGAAALRDTRADRPRVHSKCLPWTFNLLDVDARDRVRSDVLAFAPLLAARDGGHGQLLARRLRAGQVVVESAPTWRRWTSVLPQAVRDAARADDVDVRRLVLDELGAREVAGDDLLPAPAEAAGARRRGRHEPRAALRASELVGEVLDAQEAFAERRAETLAAAEDALARLGPALFEQHPSLTHVAIVPGYSPRVLTSSAELRWAAGVLRDHGLDDLGLGDAPWVAGERPTVARAVEPLARLLAPTFGAGTLLVLERLAPGHAAVRRGPWAAA